MHEDPSGRARIEPELAVGAGHCPQGFLRAVHRDRDAGERAVQETAQSVRLRFAGEDVADDRGADIVVSAPPGVAAKAVPFLTAQLGKPVQRAWVELGVPQCGYCQSGQIMSAAALLASRKKPSDREIDAAMADNICRCGTYPRIKAGIRRASEIMGS